MKYLILVILMSISFVSLAEGAIVCHEDGTCDLVIILGNAS